MKKLIRFIVVILSFLSYQAFSQGGANYSGCSANVMLEGYQAGNVVVSYFIVSGNTNRTFGDNFYSETYGSGDFNSSVYTCQDNNSTNVVNSSNCQVYVIYRYNVYYNILNIGQYLYDSDSRQDSYYFNYNCCSYA